ncbi:MAG: hypothetical protein KDG89_00015 [Geminicoccaceae bacterium]|nr:hypothetical protein [Geminicoccaceae bacterium]
MGDNRTTGVGGSSDADRLRREGAAIGDNAKTEAQGAMDEARERLRGAADEAGSEARGFVDRAKERVGAEVDARKDDVADRVEGISGRLHQSANDLRDDEAWLSRILDSGASQLDDFAGVLRQRDLPSLARSIEGFARRQPALFLGLSVTAGFLVGRFVRGGTGSSVGGYGQASGYGGPYARGSSARRDDPYAQRGHQSDYVAGSRYRDATRDWDRYEGAPTAGGTSGASRPYAPGGTVEPSGLGRAHTGTGSAATASASPPVGSTLTQGAGSGTGTSLTGESKGTP